MTSGNNIQQQIVLIAISTALTVIGFFIYSVIVKVDKIYEKQLLGIAYMERVDAVIQDIEDHEVRLRIIESSLRAKQ